MAAGHDRREVRVAPLAPRENIADLVDPDSAAGLLAPADEQPARLAVEIARREPAYPALRGRTDLRQFHKARPQPLAIDLQVPHSALSLRSAPPHNTL